jgi:ribosomal protein RSM22 (predicted rRNA methylase)
VSPYQLPDELAKAIEDSCRRGHLDARQAAELSARLRSNSVGMSYSEADVLAHTAVRVPATYAAMTTVLADLRFLLPSFVPDSLLDVGGGIGSAAWAATGTWPDLRSIGVVERNPAARALGKTIGVSAPGHAMGGVRWLPGDLADLGESADLVTVSYALGEVPVPRRQAALEALWAHTAGVLVIVEPGTPAGFAVISAASEVLAGMGAGVIAPVPFGWPCLAGPGDWLHFSVRLPRSSTLRRLKLAELAYEDEKFSYVIASRLPVETELAGRVVRHPQIRSRHLHLRICTAGGLLDLTVSKSHRDAYSLAKRLRWGSPLRRLDLHMLGS